MTKNEQDIAGAFGTIRATDTESRRGVKARLLTLLAIVGPGLIVMVGDNDAGGISTYAQAGTAATAGAMRITIVYRSPAP